MPMPIPLIPKKGFLSMLICGTLVFAGCSHKLAPEGHYQDAPVVADGNTDDWTLPLRFSNESYTMQYAVTNDNKNVYICVLSNSESEQFRILRSGMTLYFDPKGEKNKTISIIFPIQKQPDPNPSSYRSRNGDPITSTDTKSRKENLLLQSDFYNTTGFLNIENGQFAVTDRKNGIQIAMKLNNDDSVLVYEAIIPIKDILGADLNPKAAGKNFSVGVVLNAVPAQGGGNGGGRGGYGGGGMRGMGGGMMGGMGGMRGGGGRGGYGSSGRSAGAKEEDNWYAFRLAASGTTGAGNK